MKLFIVFLVICCVGCTQSSRYAFTLKGDLEGMKYGKVFLIAPGDSSKVLYTADVDGGKFVIKGELDEPGPVYSESESPAVLFLHGREEHGGNR